MQIKLVNLSIPSQQVHIEGDSKFTTQELQSFVGKIASICYTSKTYDEFLNEDAQKSIKRANNLLVSGHHSPYDQVFVKLYINNASKITLMAFNGGRFYATEEGSDRYRPMKLSNTEQQDFDTLTQLYLDQINKITPNPSKYVQKRAEKIALENARYCMPTDLQYKDIFYTASLRELNYMYNWAKNFDATKYPQVCKFMQPDLKDFTNFMENYGLVMPGLEDHFDRGFAFFKKQPPRPNEFGYNYCMSYKCSIACAGQMERHRFLNCNYNLPDNTDELEFYMPPMLKDNLKKQAEVDAIYQKYKNRYPQGSLGTMTECGNITDFLRVLYERDCAMAQFEINTVVQNNLKTYIKGLDDANNDAQHIVHYAKINADESEHIKNLRKTQVANKEYIKMLEHYKDKQYCQANGHCKGDGCGWAEGMQFTMRKY